MMRKNFEVINNHENPLAGQIYGMEYDEEMTRLAILKEEAGNLSTDNYEDIMKVAGIEQEIAGIKARTWHEGALRLFTDWRQHVLRPDYAIDRYLSLQSDTTQPIHELCGVSEEELTHLIATSLSENYSSSDQSDNTAEGFSLGLLG